ncbi:AbrB/MazE/SpoVT family DNA-binding domain-containing protein [Candidatus Woesearchaeota archaeon]|nr:AbrB/MazE/SpoVT family DNA-binding domain-containing protein [Candidatus Woesearchaeota archaeon]
MASMTKVTRNFQITLPENVRNELHVQLGDTIVLERADFGFRLHKVEKGRIEDFVGILGSFEKNISSTELQRVWRKDFERR